MLFRSEAYVKYTDEDGFAKVATIQEIDDNNFSLSIPLYVKQAEDESRVDDRNVQEHYESWRASSEMMKLSYKKLNAMLGKEDDSDE